MPLPTLLRSGLYRFPEETTTSDELPINIICDILNKKITQRGKVNKVFLLNAFTGAGKSTVFPQEMLKQIGKKYNRGIVMAEPRVDLCTNGVNDVLSYNTNWKYGVEMGKLTGVSKVVPTARAHIVFMTTQILQNFINKVMLAYNSNDINYYRRLMNKYVVIVLDEAHTHDVQTLTTIASIKSLLISCGSDPLCPVFVFTSATMDNNQFVKYFGIEECEPNLRIGTVLPVANNPITELYLNDSEVKSINTNTTNPSIRYNDIYSQIGKYIVNRFSNDILVSNIRALDGKARCRDVLIFVPTLRAITSTILSINFAIGNSIPKILVTTELSISDFDKWRNDNRGKDRYIIMGFSSTYSPLSTKLLEKPFSDDEEVLEHEMKWIVSTGAIESGKTIGTLTLCSDFGFDNKPINMPLTWKFGEKGLVVQIPACQNQITQRRGRVGRLTPGTFLGLYTNECLLKRSVDDLPDTINSGCLSISLYSMYIQTIRRPRLIDITTLNDNLFPIPPDLLINSGRDLIYGGILGTNGEWLVEDGEELWIRYARIAYYLLGYSLFDALVISSINQYNFPPKFEIETFNKSVFVLTLDEAVKKRITKVNEFIVQARNEFIRILDGKSISIIPYRGDWY